MVLGRFHHLGIAVADIAAATPFYERVMGYRLFDGPYHDPIQRVHVAFLRRDDQGLGGLTGHAAVAAFGPVIELISPASDDSPVSKYLKKDVGAYHTCYEVDSMADALAALRTEKCIIVATPAPAVAFGGRHIAWVFSPTRQLIEVLARE